MNAHARHQNPFLDFPQMATTEPEYDGDVRNITAAAAFGQDVKGGRTKARFFPALVEMAPGAEPLPGEQVMERAGKRFVMRDHVAVLNTGDRLSAHCDIAQDWHKEVYAEHWKAYREAEALPDYGTPIQELPGIINRDVMMMVLAGIQTIEEAAHLEDSLIRDIGSYARPIREKAKLWLEKRDANEAASELADLRAERERETALFREQLARMQAQMDRQAAEAEALQRVIKSGGGGRPMAVPDGAVLAGTPEATHMMEHGRVTPLFGNDAMTEGPDEYDGAWDPGEPPSED